MLPEGEVNEAVAEYMRPAAPFFNTGLRDFDRGPHDPMRKSKKNG